MSIKTSAIRFAASGGPEVLKLETVELAPPGDGEILLRHAAIGLNYQDIYQRKGTANAEGQCHLCFLVHRRAYLSGTLSKSRDGRPIRSGASSGCSKPRFRSITGGGSKTRIGGCW